MPRFAALDLGSNALRLRIVEADASSSHGTALPPRGRQRTLARDGEPALPYASGSEVFVTGKLASSSIGLACAALREFRQAMDGAKVDVYRATATSAVREASNRATLVERAWREAGIELEVIEGIEEARLIQLAVVRRLGLADKRALLVDVGGGSTELTYLDKGRSVWAVSLPIGTVRLLEMYLRNVKTVESRAAEAARRGHRPHPRRGGPTLKKLPFELVVGTGGIDTLSELCPSKGGHAGYPRAVDVASMNDVARQALLDDAGSASRSLRPPPRPRGHDRHGSVGLPPRHGELQGAGNRGPGVGLKEGILAEIVDKYFDRWDTESEARSVVDGCIRLGKRYGFDQAHGELVASLAMSLFDDMAGFHGFGERERLLLRTAALLHDVGDYVSYGGHHKHSYYHPAQRHHGAHARRARDRRERRAVSPQSRPIPAPEVPRPRQGGAREGAKPLTILRIADALDREHLGKVKSVRAKIDGKGRKMNLVITGDEERELEEWTVRAKSELLRDVFDLDVTIAGTATSARPAAREPAAGGRPAVFSPERPLIAAGWPRVPPPMRPPIACALRYSAIVPIPGPMVKRVEFVLLCLRRCARFPGPDSHSFS